RVLVKNAIRRIRSNDLLIVEQKCRATDVEDLTGAGAEKNVLRLDAMMLRDLLGDAAIRIAVPVSVLEGLRHRLQHAVRRPIWILVVRELGEGVVFVHRLLRARSVGGCRGLRPERGSRLQREKSEGGRNAPNEASARNGVLHFHGSLRSRWTHRESGHATARGT